MIKVNGNDMEWEAGLTVQGLLEKCKYTFPHIVVKVNGIVIHRENYNTTHINDGDDVQIIHLIGGG